MTTRKKLLIAVLIVAGAGSTAGYSIFARNRGVVAVEAGHVVQQDLTQTVSANGEIKPKKDVNVSSNMMGRIIRLPVKEGDRVHEGDLLVQLESIQSEADVKSAEASLDAAAADVEGTVAQIRSADAAVASAKAEITRSEADLLRARQNFDRQEQLSKQGLIAKDAYEKAKADYEIAEATLNSDKARLAQAEAQSAQMLKQRDSTAMRVAQQRAALVRAKDQFSKTTIRATLDGVITYLPVNEGETAIVGVQNQAGTILMTIADLSVITAEVNVDETDIVNVKLGQEARIKVDALGDKVLLGHVSEVGNSALTRSSGTASTATAGTSQEAKDFKVVVTLDNPPSELRPGLSCTATIVTATRPKILTVPIQALTIREFDAAPAAVNKDSNNNKKKVEKEGVFTLKDGVALFRPVKTGITGTTDIEILEGLSENDNVVTGPYQVLRTLQDNTRIKIDKAQ
ncbi:MAG TPA: efflux RND transporter periplasmic adaptor subunit [Terriglobia bacterium]|jgi:HlyD family secretion protein